MTILLAVIHYCHDPVSCILQDAHYSLHSDQCSLSNPNDHLAQTAPFPGIDPYGISIWDLVGSGAHDHAQNHQ